jgi:hypothetical protein
MSQEKRTLGAASIARRCSHVVKDGFHHWPELESDCPPEPPPVRPPTLPPDFPDIPQNPSSELQPSPDPFATPGKVAGTRPAPAEPEAQGKPRPASEKRRAGGFAGEPTRHSL